MSEEEKKAIEYLKENSKEGASFWCYEAIPNFKKVLKLIEKQQKEINQEKEKNKKMFNRYEKRVNELEREIAINLISKDKIKKLIHSYSIEDKRFMKYLKELLEE